MISAPAKAQIERVGATTYRNQFHRADWGSASWTRLCCGGARQHQCSEDCNDAHGLVYLQRRRRKVLGSISMSTTASEILQKDDYCN